MVEGPGLSKGSGLNSRLGLSENPGISKGSRLDGGPGLSKGPGLVTGTRHSKGPELRVLPLIIAPAVEFGASAPAGSGQWLLAGGTPQTALMPGGPVHPQQEAVRDGASTTLAAPGSLVSRVCRVSRGRACRDKQEGEALRSGQ